MTSVLIVMQPGRTLEMMPHLPCATLQQPSSGAPCDITAGQDVSAVAGGSQPVGYIGFVLFAPQTCAPLTVAQHAYTHMFIM
jgi:hypothetical protein